MNQLTGLYFSPWTERARWALDWHRVPYRYHEYTTLLGEPALRIRARRLIGKVSVPMLVTAHERFTDSFAIARHADGCSSGRQLIPEAQVEAIRQWVDDAELALCSARVRATRRMKRSAGSLAERLPGWVPGSLRRPMVPISWLGAEYILRKYKVSPSDDDTLLLNMETFLGRVEHALGTREYVYGAFSFADIVIATMLQAVTPVDRRYIDLGAASEQVMCEPVLAAKYAPLIAWRDAIYARHR